LGALVFIGKESLAVVYVPVRVYSVSKMWVVCCQQMADTVTTTVTPQGRKHQSCCTAEEKQGRKKG
jgi:hypothetical protein